MPLAQSSVIDDTDLVDNWSLLLTNKSKCTKEGFSSYSNDSSLVGSKYAYELSFSLFIGSGDGGTSTRDTRDNKKIS